LVIAIGSNDFAAGVACAKCINEDNALIGKTFMAFLVESFSVWLILVMLTTLLLTYRKTIYIFLRDVRGTPKEGEPLTSLFVLL
jgi:hypothetical protein